MKPTPETIFKIRTLIGEITGVDPQNFEPKHENGKVKRDRELVASRHLLMYVLKNYSKMSLREIGRQYNDKKFHHATVIHAVKTINNAMETDKGVKAKYDELFKKAEKLIKQEAEEMKMKEEELQRQDEEEKQVKEKEAEVNQEQSLKDQVLKLQEENSRIIKDYQVVLTAKTNIEMEYRKVVSELKYQIDGLQGDVRLLKGQIQREKMLTVSY